MRTFNRLEHLYIIRNMKKQTDEEIASGISNCTAWQVRNYINLITKPVSAYPSVQKKWARELSQSRV